MDVTISGPN